MELLLIQLEGSGMCVDMNDVSRVVPLSQEMVATNELLVPAGNAPLGIVLKNRRILPVGRLLKTVTFQGKKYPLDPFLKGCFRQTIIEGFIIAEKGIYGLLSRGFLQMNDHDHCRENDMEHSKEHNQEHYREHNKE